MPWHFLYFLPLPQGQGWLRPIFCALPDPLATTAGKIYTGILVEKSEKHVVLNVFKEGKTEALRIPAADVDELVPQKKSLMPDGLLRDLSPQQAADLLAFLSSLTTEPKK